MPELPNWLDLDNRLAIVVSVVLGLLLLIAVFALTFRRKKAGVTPTRATPAFATKPAAATVNDEGFAIDLSKSSIEDWLRPPASKPAGTLIGSEYRLGALEGARSKQHLAVVPDAKYCVDFTAAAIADPTNGGRSNFFVGPMFLDASGNVVGWWKQQNEIKVAEGPRVGVVEASAPAGAATVHISVHGSWEKQQEVVPGNGLIAFSRLALRRVD